ncbi:MAG: hypothetical protein IKZ51_02440 [Bacteroidales bacterium]|nr:hypothetical protein [Bacteroidales bacterium]
MEFGLIGEHLGHSFSREIHGMLCSEPYELRELSREELPGFLKERDFRGINVTIPYKREVMPHLDGIAESALACGAVNCIVNNNGKLTGYNTDYDGFIALARHAGVDFKDTKVIVLGAGGAASAVAAAASSMGAASVSNACRRPAEGQLQLADPESWSDCDIIVNATPVGMYPDWQGRLLDLSLFPKLRGVLDCIYNPLRTQLVLDAQARGIPADGGLYMLVGQAIRARELFDGSTIPEERCAEVYGRILNGKRNIVLTGMPSCGKTTVGRELAARTGRHYIDIDEVISLQAGMEIPEIFSREGEEGFRKRETVAIESVAAEQGVIIATGGGAVLKDENVRLLRHNGIICLLQRNLGLLTPTADRPLSRDRASLQALYERRLPFYLRAAELKIDNNGPLERTIEELEKLC